MNATGVNQRAAHASIGAGNGESECHARFMDCGSQARKY